MATQESSQPRASEPTDDQVGLAVETLKLLADPTRLRIVWALLHGEHSVNELADHVGGQPAAVSQHLAKLRLSRLVKTRRQGTRIFYEAQDTHVRQLIEEALFHADHVVRDIPDHGRTRQAAVGHRESHDSRKPPAGGTRASHTGRGKSA